ncbi:MAG: hypothetical protein EAZ39_09975 [Oscillatoriales cyanobacterium]|nr:hypothetical protein [Microcoleus sp. PH2017_30_WIL_O_A]TAF97240.1 MAG: hypothetical protein EAZ45_22255 [Oscillatoriales cyanobacterium]TAG19183.1 MAG: hypothetical protein EAZ39_09975 [Oscillatoriales cyanobacterium]TAG49350.1 MAG: hypothetical protein EAZ33_01585 [Oscillatoriales cyanobacterium]TAG53210.1 MAG: hypothetical protein EAZ28_28060 [Oscillatoriales cyanobacterium]
MYNIDYFWVALSMFLRAVMGEAVAVRAIAAIRLRVSPVCVRKQGKQPQNWRALAVNRSGHLMRKYRLTYHQKNG